MLSIANNFINIYSCPVIILRIGIRHIYDSLIIENGASLAYIQTQMGHSSIQTTVDVYGHLVPGANRHKVDKLDAILAENAPYTHPTKTKELQEVPQLLDYNRADGDILRLRRDLAKINNLAENSNDLDLLITKQLAYA